MIFFDKKIYDFLNKKGLKKYKDTTISYSAEWVDLNDNNKLMITSTHQPFGVRIEVNIDNVWQKIRSFKQLQELVN